MKLVLQLFAGFFACLLITQVAAYRRSSVVARSQGCRRNGICRWAICPWAQRIWVPTGNCQFVEECSCPSELRCLRSDQIPRAGHIIFQFRCQ